MTRPLYVFNPEHDLALANDDANFNAPLSARKLASDLSCLPLWYAAENGVVWSNVSSLWLAEIQTLFPQLNSIFVTKNPDSAEISSVHPWGWDKAIVKQLTVLREDDVSDRFTGLYPNKAGLSHIKRLSHRGVAINALKYLRSGIESALLPEPAAELTDISQVGVFVGKQLPVIFKAPWSGSGKGLSWVRTGLTESHRGWCRNIIDKQGSVIAERVYDVVQDFAMLFSCENGRCCFAGYSLFETEKGIYRNNLLMSNDTIFNHLNNNYFQSDLLEKVQFYLQKFIESEIAIHYSGMLGVDMFVYRENGVNHLHPCVEINLRMTMGCVARIFYDRFVEQDLTGRFYIDHFPEKGKLIQKHNDWKQEFPLRINNFRISSGYLPLTQLRPDSNYVVRVVI